VPLLDESRKLRDGTLAPAFHFDPAADEFAYLPLEVDQGRIHGRQGSPTGGLDHLHDLREGLFLGRDDHGGCPGTVAAGL
jgi:hypothetical protein